MTLLLMLFCNAAMALNSIVFKTDNPIGYKRYLEVTTLFNEGADTPFPFFFTMVMDLRIPISDEGRTVMSALTLEPVSASNAHDEAVSWAIRMYAHLRIVIPDGTDGLELRYLEPTIRRRAPDFSQTEPISISIPTIEERQAEMAFIVPHLPTPQNVNQEFDTWHWSDRYANQGKKRKR